MDSEETIVWVPTSHKIFMLAMGLVLTTASVYFWLNEEFTGIGLLFILTYSIFSLGILVFALKLVVAPKPTIIFDSTGFSISRNATKTPWNHVDTIERVAVGGYQRISHGIAIRLIENSEFKPDTNRAIIEWDRKEKYDFVVWKRYCDVQLDELQKQLVKFQEGFSETKGAG